MRARPEPSRDASISNASISNAAIRAGILAGIAGFTTFLVIHAAWIVPIWFIVPAGALVAGTVGASVGAAYEELLPHLPRRPWTAFAVGLFVVIVLAPAFIIGQVHGPVYAVEPDGRGTLLVSVTEALGTFVMGLLATATIAGAAIGWLLAGTCRAAGLTALAALLVALGPGHNIPLLGGTPAVAMELVILVVVIGASSVVLVEGHAWLVRLRSGPIASGGASR